MAATEGLAGTEGLVRAPKGYYKVETAPSGRSACQACHSTIDYGELRLGVMIENPSYPGWWKYRTCMTDRVVANISSHENLNGFDLLSDEDQATVIDTFNCPPEPKPRKKPVKKPKLDSEGEEVEEAPKRARKKRAAPKKKKGQVELDSDGEEIEPEPKPRKKAAPRKRKGATAAAAPAAAAAAAAALAPAGLSPLQQLLAAELARAFPGGIPAELRSYFAGPAEDAHMHLLVQTLKAAAILPPAWPAVMPALALPLLPLPVVAPALAPAPAAPAAMAEVAAAAVVKPEEAAAAEVKEEEVKELPVIRQLEYAAAAAAVKAEPADVKEEAQEDAGEAAKPKRQKRAPAGKKKKAAAVKEEDEEWVPPRAGMRVTRSRSRRGE